MFLGGPGGEGTEEGFYNQDPSEFGNGDASDSDSSHRASRQTGLRLRDIFYGASQEDIEKVVETFPSKPLSLFSGGVLMF